MHVPADLEIEIRFGKIVLRSAGRAVELEYGGRQGIFRDGPLKWTDVEQRYLAPAFAQLAAK